MLLQTLFNKVAQKNDSRLIKNLAELDYGKRLRTTVSAFALLAGTHVAAMMGLEGMSLSDAIWVTLTTATTVGYGDVSAHTNLGRLATILLMYGPGIALATQAIGLSLEYRQVKREKISEGKWSWKMNDHIVFLNSPRNCAGKYFERLMTDFRSSALPGSQKPAIIVSPDLADGLSDDLRKLHVAHVNEVTTDKAGFEKSDLKNASVIVILSPDEHDPASDSIIYDLIARVQEVNPGAQIIAEAASDDNRRRFIAAGAEHVIRPLRSYPELLVRTILAPGTEVVIEEIFSSAGGETKRYDVPISGRWSDIAVSLIQNDVGMPMAFIDNGGKVVTEAHPNYYVEGKAVIVLARQGNMKDESDVACMLASLPRVGGHIEPAPI